MTSLRAKRLQAARHEIRCAGCRVTWRSWFQRLIGDPRGMGPGSHFKQPNIEDVLRGVLEARGDDAEQAAP